MFLFDSKYLHPFRRYSPPELEVTQSWAKFCMFLAPEIFFGKDPLKFWTSIIKFGLVLITMQKFHVDRLTHLGDRALK